MNSSSQFGTFQISRVQTNKYSNPQKFHAKLTKVYFTENNQIIKLSHILNACPNLKNVVHNYSGVYFDLRKYSETVKHKWITTPGFKF